ncbi:hypothetical protein F5888DRAFT_1808339 [Russula emetica]|nr:hypothetical protein F5888DRAFT_1808339 [Russula emetica]
MSMKASETVIIASTKLDEKPDLWSGSAQPSNLGPNFGQRRYALDVVFKLRPANPAYPLSGHGPDIYCAPSPYRGAPEHAILSRSRGPSPNPMGGSGPGMYGQRAPSPIPGAMPSYGGNRSRAPSPIPGTLPPGQYPQLLNRSRAPSPLGAPPPYTGSLVSHTLMLFRGPHVSAVGRP